MMECQLLKNLVLSVIFMIDSNIELSLSVKGRSSVQNIIQLQNSEWISKIEEKKRSNEMKELLHKCCGEKKEAKIFFCVLLLMKQKQHSLYSSASKNYSFSFVSTI